MEENRNLPGEADEVFDDVNDVLSLVAYDEMLAAGQGTGGLHCAQSALERDNLADDKECLRLLDELWHGRRSPPADAEPVSESAIESDSHVDAQRRVASAPSANPSDGIGSSLGRFQIVREVGRGGWGIVFEGYDPQLDRKVAIKVPKPAFLFSSQFRSRFLAEGRAAAQLDHPNIVSIHESGKFGCICYIAFAFCDGPTLAEWMNEQGGPKRPREAAELVLRLANAVEYAHVRGVVHRDLKPSNILLEPLLPAATLDSDLNASAWLNYVPRIIDFGLAKLLESEAQDTHTGEILGTPEYMSPEQAQGRSDAIGFTSDVYSLGVILYELLSGKPPFQGETKLATLQKIVSEEPPLLRKSVPGAPHDLEAICLKCLEKEPAQRYARAGDLADDLRRFLTQRPTVARPAGSITRLRKWARRQPALAGLAAVAILSALGILFGVVGHRVRVLKMTEAFALLQSDVRHKERLDDYADAVQGAYRAWRNGDVQSALDLLANYDASAGEDDLRGFEWYYVRRLCESNLWKVRSHGRASHVAFSPDQQTVASCGNDGVIRFWSIADGSLLNELQTGCDSLSCLAFSPDGKYLAYIADGSQINLWTMATKGRTASLVGHSGQVRCLAFSPDSQTLASGGDDGSIRLWEVATAKEREVVQAHDGTVWSLVFSRDGGRLASGSSDNTGKIWDVSELGKPLVVIGRHNVLYAVALSPDGQTIATAGGGLIDLWDAVTGSHLNSFGGHRNYVRSISYSPDGKLLATGSWDSTVFIWNVETGKRQDVLRGHASEVDCATFASERNLIATAGRDGTVRVWDASTWQDRWTVPVEFTRLMACGFSDDSRMLSVGSYADGGCKIWRWDIARRQLLSNVDLRPVPVSCESPIFSPVGDVLAWPSNDGHDVHLCDARQITVQKLATFSTSVHIGAFSHNGQRLAVFDSAESGKVRILDTSSGEPLVTVPGRKFVAFSPDGRSLATNSIGPQIAIVLYDVETGEQVGMFNGDVAEVYAAAFSPDGKVIGTGSNDGSVKIWDVTTQREKFTLQAHDGDVSRIAFSPDGRRLVSCDRDGKVIFWDVRSGRELLTLQVGEKADAIWFSPDGQVLASASNRLAENSQWRGQVQLWFAPR